jgi:hypothetical protein
MLRLIILFALLILFNACTATMAIYGVPQHKWEAMSDEERAATIEHYQAQQQIYQATREQAELSRQQALALAKQCHNLEQATNNKKCKVSTKRRFLFW